MFDRCYCLWEKSWQPYPRNSSCNLEKNSGLIPKIWRQSSFKWIWDLFDILNLVNWSYFGQKVSVMKTFQKVVGIYVLSSRAPHCTSNPPHWATGQGLSVGCTALRGWSYICWKPRYMGCTILWFYNLWFWFYIQWGGRYTSEVGPFICQSQATLRNVVEPRRKRVV